MRKIILPILLLLSIASLSGFVNKEDYTTKRNGIVFEKITFDEAIKKAKTEKKYIFIDVYAKSCGTCKTLKKKTFKDKEVGNYFNKNFINIAIDGETDEGLFLIKKYGIQSYPTLLIVDANGNLKTKQVGFVKPYILINFGRRVVP